MEPSYLPYALLAMGAYAFVSPLMRVATTGPDAVPSDVAVVVSNTLLVAMALGVLAYTGQEFAVHLGSPKIPYVLAAGVFLGVGILALYRSLALGPVSVVTPIFATFLVFSSLIGVALLGESFSARKALGIAFAVLSVYLVSGT
ncbi:EamA family transporter [Halorubrum sp. CBA1125]|uniref:EamA family transporter n=1 Tax=Halorubrum sp. CBA1125 TaxID=2668072 RepID=UPI0012E8CDAA|nr:EamA family transporter [Halorubrum sp. CBA1125]MUW14145.1 EamA family transporter [Halorubrum sp. CBA1125]